MTEVSALMGIVQLKRIQEFIQRRTEIANIYTERLKNIDSVELLKISDRVCHNWFKYILFLKRHDRETLHLKLKNDYGINLSGYIYEIPLHQQPALDEFKNGLFPNAEDLCNSHICLPLFFSMTNEDTNYVADSLIKCLD